MLCNCISLIVILIAAIFGEMINGFCMSTALDFTNVDTPYH